MVSKAANTAEVTETREEAAEAPLLDTVATAIKGVMLAPTWLIGRQRFRRMRRATTSTSTILASSSAAWCR